MKEFNEMLAALGIDQKELANNIGMQGTVLSSKFAATRTAPALLQAMLYIHKKTAEVTRKGPLVKYETAEAAAAPLVKFLDETHKPYTRRIEAEVSFRGLKLFQKVPCSISEVVAKPQKRNVHKHDPLRTSLKG